MTHKTDNHYKVTAKVRNGLGVIARMTIMLRKFNVNIQSFDVEALDDEKRFYNIHFVLDSTKDNREFEVVMKKLERLIPVVKVDFTKQPNGQ